MMFQFHNRTEKFPNPAACVFFFLLASVLPPLFPAHADDWPFVKGANWGGTGLFETPNARILADGEVRAGFAIAEPYRWVTGALGVLPGVEISGRFTEISNIPSGLGPAFGANKDKAFDVKYQIVPETRWLPAVALGLHDFHGTGLFEAKFLALSRQIFPFDFTLGFGNGRLRGPLTLPFQDSIGVFGGVEWAMTEKLHLMAEYNPIEYEKDRRSARGVPEGAAQPVNVGIRYQVFPGIEMGMSYQRGNTLALSITMQAMLGAPLQEKLPDHPPLAPVDNRPFTRRDPKNLVENITRALEERGFTEVRTRTDGLDIFVEFENGLYFSETKAAGRVMRTALLYAPEDTRKITAALKRLGIPVMEMSAHSSVLDAFFRDEITEDVLAAHMEVRMLPPGGHAPGPMLASSEYLKKSDFFFGIKPDFEPYLNDPAGVFSARYSVKPYIRVSPWPGGSFFGRYAQPLYSDVETNLPPPPPGAIRSDVVDYRGTSATIDRLLFDQLFHLETKTYARLSAGWFEEMFAGVGGEILRVIGDGRFSVGVEGDWARKREPGSLLSLGDLESHTYFGNLYYSIPSLKAIGKLQYGRFLAKDKGFRLTMSREYDTGAVFGAWYSLTDTNHMTGFNRNYNDKGVFLALPLAMFTQTPTTRRLNYAASPWTRDVGQTMAHTMEAFSTISDLLPINITNDLHRLKD